MNLNVDVIDNGTGEIYREGVLLANAHLFIAKEKGEIVKQEVSWCQDAGGGEIQVLDIFVDFPEERRKRDLSADAIIKAREFWQYENGGGQVRS